MALLVGLCGCGRAAGVLFEPGPGAPFWPAAPERARIRYLGELRTDADLHAGRRAGQRLGEFLFGKEDSKAMLSPMSVSTIGSRVFVADSNGQVVHVFDLDLRRYQQWRPGHGQRAFAMPVAVAAEVGGGVLVSDSVAGQVFRFNASGACTGVIGAGSLQRPCGILIRGDRVLVVDSAAHQIVVFDREGREEKRVGQRGVHPGEFNFPTSLTANAGGRVYVSDTLNFRVQVLDPDLRPLRVIGKKGDVPGTFGQPKGVAVDGDGHLFVVDANFEAVQVFDDAGQLLLSFGSEGRGAGQFWLPSGICIDGTGRVFIADVYNRRVQVFQYVAEDSPS